MANAKLNTTGPLWVVHIGKSDKIALRALKEGFTCIGWTDIGDLSLYDTREKMRAAMDQTFPAWKPKKVSSSYGQPFRFVHEMEIDDLVVFPVRPTSEIAVGRVAGPYKRAANDQELVENDYENVRPVEWLKIVPRTTFSQAALHSFGSFSSVSTSDDHMEEVLAVIAGDPYVGGDPSKDPEDDSDSEEAPDLFEQASQETEDYLLKAWQRTGAEFEEVVAEAVH